MKPVTVDFETFGILPRPDYPPRPVGVAIKRPGRKARYYAWDHQTGQNNCTREQAVAALQGFGANLFCFTMRSSTLM